MKKGFFRSFLALSLSGAMLAGCSVNSVMRSVNDAATDSNFNMQDIIPYIGDNGNWWIGGSDTGVSATGQAGKDGQDGKDGHDGQDGRDGHDGQDGQTPYIGPNGNWWIGDTDTGVSAEGAGGAEHAGEIFRVTFDANGGFNGMGQTVWDVEVEWGNTVPLPIPERAGFSFLGWFSGTGDSVRAFLETDAVFTNIHLTAQWAPRNYTIYLDANGGYFDGSSEISVTYWEAYHLPTYVTRNGYVFKGWYEGDNQWSYDGTYGSSNDVWLTAKWEVGVQYTITLDLNGGRFADGYDYLTDKIVVIPGNWYELPRSWQLFKENYEFQGWYDEGDNYFSESGSYNLSNGITLKAKWAETQYQIYLQPNGGELENGVSQYQYYYYHRTYELPIPHKEGYSFLGWYEGDNLWPNSGVYSRKESVTLTARWEVRTEFTLKLNLNKGTYEGASATEWTVALGDYYELPTEGLVRDGYVFAGWYYGEVRWADSGTYPVKDDRTLAAKWMEKENYRFYLDFQGGFYAGEPNASVAFNNDHAYYGDVPTLPIPSKDNATFDGYAYQYRWNKVVNNLGKVEDYPWAGGSTNSNGEVQVTLTARWKDGVSEGDTIYFGEYPQTVVEDQNLLANLESREADENNIVEFSGNRYKKAACDTDYWNGGIKSSSKETTFKYGNTYFFKIEPIEWKILENKDGSMTLLSEKVLDSQRFSNINSDRIIDGLMVYPNNYEHSSVRKWLNEDFYASSFAEEEKARILETEIDNSPSTGYTTPNRYACDDTVDKVFLLSYQEASFRSVWDPETGSSSYKYDALCSSYARSALSTDWVRAHRVDSMNTSGNSYGSVYWALRSPGYPDYPYICSVSYEGGQDSWRSVDSYSGVRPAITITIP